MKKNILLFYLILFIGQLNAQIGKINIENSQPAQCNHNGNGIADLILNDSINDSTDNPPPYSYQWSDGETTRKAIHLPEGPIRVIITNGAGNRDTILFYMPGTFCHMEGSPVFTPNGDGINDEWNISNSEFFPDVRILVYNRLGQKVYEHKEGPYNEPWEGNDIVGTPVPDGAYYYIIYEDKSDKSNIVKGCVSIIR